jgi:Rrf2 family protein
LTFNFLCISSVLNPSPLLKAAVELSCKSEYGILALLELAIHYQSGEPLQIRQIAAQQNIPDRYLEQLLATLRRGGIVKSQRGSKGGYLLAREPWKISLFEVLSCLEGLDVRPCEEDVNPKTIDSAVVEDIWQEARLAANAVLQKYTLAELCEKRDSRRQLDIMYYI